MNVPPESLLELAYQTLKDNILRGVYPAGSKLPVDRLSRELSISSTPITAWWQSIWWSKSPAAAMR